MAIVLGTFTYSQWKFQGLSYRSLLFSNAKQEAISLVTMNARLCTSSGSRRVKLTIAESLFCFPFCLVKSQLYASKLLQAWLLEVRTKRSKQSGLNEKNNWLYDDREKVSFNSTEFSSDHTIADFNFRLSQIIQWSSLVLFDPAESQDVVRGMRSRFRLGTESAFFLPLRFPLFSFLILTVNREDLRTRLSTWKMADISLVSRVRTRRKNG